MASLLDRIGGRLLRNRRFVRAPIWLYRHHLGGLLGPRVLLLRHTGRVSGLTRYVCLEVIDRPSPHTVIVASGFGDRAQWYRNLRADPACALATGFRRTAAAQARVLTAAEAERTLSRYQQAHLLAWRRLRGTIESAVGGPVTALPMVALTLDR